MVEILVTGLIIVIGWVLCYIHKKPKTKFSDVDELYSNDTTGMSTRPLRYYRYNR